MRDHTATQQAPSEYTEIAHGPELGSSFHRLQDFDVNLGHCCLPTQLPHSSCLHEIIQVTLIKFSIHFFFYINTHKKENEENIL